LPYASTLCGACYDVCPVAIDIPEILVHLRERVAEQGEGHRAERAAMRAATWLLDHPAALSAVERAASATRGLHPARLPLPGPAKAWSDARDLPEVAAEPFRAGWKKARGAGGAPRKDKDTPR
ncbi:lactate utilization protein LutB domain-containing protein, partial [Streptomyces sp. NPDC088194]|uniref:lactate utilisation protein LutB domain-containing protein n=1 Tax=Streptomyces sp. NPDC088194 TaxID=3154931 RepID=UPI00344C63FB